MTEFSSISRPLKIAEIEVDPTHVTLEASESDRPEIAKAFGLRSIDRLKGTVEVTRHGTLIRVTGALEADLGRTCVVSLEPMQELLNEDFAVEFTTDAPNEPGEEAEGDLDAPEYLDGDALDLGEVLIEQLVLAMDPHPRKEDAEAPVDPGAGEGSSPFDVLKGLKS